MVDRRLGPAGDGEHPSGERDRRRSAARRSGGVSPGDSPAALTHPERAGQREEGDHAHQGSSRGRCLRPRCLCQRRPRQERVAERAVRAVEGRGAVCAPSLRSPGHEKSAWVLSRYEDVSMMLREPDRFLSGSGVTMRATHTTVSEDGGKAGHDHHGRSGARAQPAPRQSRLHPGGGPQLRGALPDDRRATSSSGPSTSAHSTSSGRWQASSRSTPSVTCWACRMRIVPALARWTNTLTTPTDPEYAPTPGEFFEAMEHMWAYGLELAELRRRNPGTDVMSVIVAAADNDTLSEDELMGFVFTLAAAGNETTRNSASHALLALLQRPGQMAWLRERAGRIPESAIEELLRWSSPVIYIRRTAACDLEMSGTAHRSRGSRRRIRGLRQLRRRRVRGTTRARSRRGSPTGTSRLPRAPTSAWGPTSLVSSYVFSSRNS